MTEKHEDRRSTHEWTLAAPPDDVDTSLDFLRRVWASEATVSTDDRVALETAVVELTGNVIEHAAGQTPDLMVHIVVTVDCAAVLVEVRDAGGAVEVDFAGIAMPGETAESGRGIPMIRALVDEFAYDRRDGINHWRLLRARRILEH